MVQPPYYGACKVFSVPLMKILQIKFIMKSIFKEYAV